MTKKISCIHKYQRTTLGKNFLIYRCMVPGCSHYVSAKLMLNRICECWRCGNPMVIDKYSAHLAKPHCENCVERTDSDKIDRLTELFS